MDTKSQDEVMVVQWGRLPLWVHIVFGTICAAIALIIFYADESQFNAAVGCFIFFALLFFVRAETRVDMANAVVEKRYWILGLLIYGRSWRRSELMEIVWKIHRAGTYDDAPQNRVMVGLRPRKGRIIYIQYFNSSVGEHFWAAQYFTSKLSSVMGLPCNEKEYLDPKHFDEGIGTIQK
ncbi:MAG: hypothetical protein LBV12_12145 [Puniceicoccales bacterium]|nr:hypothetical protein [Puniceicoccales bacterium]